MFGVELKAAVASVAVLAAAWPVGAAGSEPPWQRLEFRARKLFLSADAAVEFQAAAALPAARCRSGSSLPAAAARIRIESAMLGRRSVSSLWFDPESLVAHVRVQEERGSRNRYKRYTFCEERVEAERATPNAGETSLPAALWTHRYPLVHEAPAGLGAPLSEPSALLYLVGRLAGMGVESSGVSRTVPVFSNRQVLAVRIDRAPEPVPAEPKFSIAGGPSPEELTLVRFTLTPVAVGQEGKVEDFELLGLEGEIVIFAASELQAPVSISGRLPPAGRVTVRLRHVELGGSE